LSEAEGREAHARCPPPRQGGRVDRQPGTHGTGCAHAARLWVVGNPGAGQLIATGMKVTRVGDGARIRLNIAESHVVEQLLEDLRAIVEPEGLVADDPVRQRLYPAAYQDASDAEAFRSMTESALQAERSERVGTCLAE